MDFEYDDPDIRRHGAPTDCDPSNPTGAIELAAPSDQVSIWPMLVSAALISHSLQATFDPTLMLVAHVLLRQALVATAPASQKLALRRME